ncbi:MAG: PQQ-binding-like beta-propeller repeat protein [Limisphaerales bacterium]
MKLTCTLFTGLCLAATAVAEDWPTFMHDRARSGVSGEALTLPLNELWSYTPPAEPTRAWPSPQAGYNELPKLAFDDATHVAMIGDTVFFGSAVDNGIHAVDARTGAKRWTFFTEGPVRLAPTVAAGRVYAGSDDGLVYCLDAKDGRLVWNARSGAGTGRALLTPAKQGYAGPSPLKCALARCFAASLVPVSLGLRPACSRAQAQFNIPPVPCCSFRNSNFPFPTTRKPSPYELKD